MSLRKGHVDILEERLAGYPFYPARGLDQVVAGETGLFAAQSVGEDEWLGKLTGAHDEAGVVDGPLAF
jgi:hypothetical protein